MELTREIKNKLGIVAEYDKESQWVWLKKKNGDLYHLLEIRGWGTLQYLFKDKKGNIDLDKAAEFQDQIGKWVEEAINTKLNERK